MSSEPPEQPRKMRTVYSREFLISIGGSDLCKNLPSGFDASVLSELQEASSTAIERSRVPFVAPLGRSDGSRGGRWDTRPTGSSDREGDLTDRELLTQDRRNGNQSKRSWQTTEHDGLLGSGGFPRPSGYAGQLASKDRGNAPQPNRASERYQPPVPRPYKAGPLSRKDVDSMNDETFGSFECSNKDRAEEERKRRASFELMRKEQHKSLQEKKNGPDNEKGNPGSDLMSVLQNSTEKIGATTKSGKPDGYGVSSLVPPASAARPLVPPGFSNAFVEKKVQSQSPNISIESKTHIADSEDTMPSIVQFGARLDRNPSATEIIASKNKEKCIPDNLSSVDRKHTLLSESVTSSTEFASSILKGAENWEADAMDKYSVEKQGSSGSVRMANSIQALEEFFGNTLSKSGDNLLTNIESHQLNTDNNMMVPSVPQSSKFASWFNEDLKPPEDLPSKSLLSMIVKNESPGLGNVAPGPCVSDVTIQNLSSRLPTDKSDASSKLPSFTSPAPAGIPEPAPTMMTCEDLEQTMLAQVASNSSSAQKNTVEGHEAVLHETTTTQKAAVDNHASHHLLSLLQKGADNKGSSPFGFHIGSADEFHSSNVSVMNNGGIFANPPINTREAVTDSGKSVTLEALFGTAFMNELHSKDAPVSIRGSASSHEGYYPGEQALPFNNNDGVAPKEPRTVMEYRNSSLTGPSQGSASFDRNGLGIHLPEEDNLFTMNDSFGARKPDILPSMRSNRVEMQLPEKAVYDINYRLQSLVPSDVEHVPILGSDGLGSHSREQRYQVESQNIYHRIPAVAPRPMMDYVGNMNQQVPFDMPQGMRHDPHRSFPTNMNHMQHTLNAPAVSHLDTAARHHMLQRIPGGFPSEGLPRGVPPSQSVHRVAGYRPQMSNVNNFYMHPRQPSYGGLMMPGPSGPEVRGNHPEAFDRLMQMSLQRDPNR